MEIVKVVCFCVRSKQKKDATPEDVPSPPMIGAELDAGAKASSSPKSNKLTSLSFSTGFSGTFALAFGGGAGLVFEDREVAEVAPLLRDGTSPSKSSAPSYSSYSGCAAWVSRKLERDGRYSNIIS